MCTKNQSSLPLGGSEIVKTSIIEFFYDHVEENDWLTGLDLYTAGKVEKIRSMHGLVTSKVTSISAKAEETRLKIHPNGHCIQWLECTCKKNRTSGQLCEHLAAFMICIDRETPNILANLDARMPMKHPIASKKKQLKTTESIEKKEKSEGAAQTILSHLKGNIQNVRLLANGPALKVRLEIKNGEFTNYHLDLDDAARFLQSHTKLTNATEEVKKLKVFGQLVCRGTRIYQEEDEKIVAERVFAIAHSMSSFRKCKEEFQEQSIFPESHTLILRNEPNGTEGLFEFIPLKSAQKYQGKEFFFLPHRGYWKIKESDVTAKWFDLPMKKTFKDDASAEFIQTNFREYLDEGPIWLEESLKGAFIENTPKLSEIHILKSTDGWFYLDPQYNTNGESISMVEFLEQYRKKKREFLKQGSKWIKIPDFIKDQPWELDESGKYLKVTSLGLIRLKAAVGDFDKFVGSKKLLNQIRDQLEFSNEVEVPDLSHTRLTLREYQQTGVQWMWWLYSNKLHGLLADEMGLGKTHQAMGLMSAIQSKSDKAVFLVIAPTTVLDHWEDKVMQFCPNLKPVKHHGPKRNQNIKKLLEDHNLILTSYGVLLRDIRQISTIEWNALILDEAHFVKNQDTATYQAVCKVNAEIRLCLTGTPIENHLGELKNIFDFLVPGYLGSDEYFKKNFSQAIDKNRESEAEFTLQKLIHPFKLRRAKANVLQDLPEKVEDIRHCTLSEQQIKLYKEVLDMKARPIVEALRDDASPVPYLHVFAILTLLKQVCNHPSLVKQGTYDAFDSGKFELLKELLSEALDSGHKIVIYSQYVEMIKIISSYLTKQAIKHVVLTGQSKNRGKLVETFQTNDECKVFLGSLLAGGIGIDLTAASVVIHYDRWWNASKENQATDRVYRIGQNKNVQVLKLVTRGTLEEKIDSLIASKKELFEKFMDRDEELFKTFTRSQLIDLLQ